MPKQIRSIEGITEYELSNGLRLLLYPDVSRPSVTVNLTVFVGSRHEGYGEAGMAHLLEHMLFKGTPSHPDISSILKERGARANGTTWLDRTNYYETMSASDENLEFAIRLEADRMVNSYIKAEDLASEMTVVRNEFEGTENNIRRVLSQKMMSSAFQWHNYGKTTIGNRADIERMPVEKLRQFYKRFYQPDNAMLIVAGKFDKQKALQFAAQYFGAIARPERELDQTYTEEPPQDGDKLVTVRRVGDVPIAGLLYHIPAGGHPDFAAVDVMSTILTSQPSGRLYESLVKKRQAASAYGSTFSLHDPGMMLLMCNAARGVESPNLLLGMIDAVENGTAFGEKEVDRARQQLLRQRDQTVRDSKRLAIELSDWAAQGDWRLFFLYRDYLEQVTTDDVNRAAAQFLTRNNRTAGLFEPTKEAERVYIPPTPNLQQMIGDYKGREQIVQGEEFDPSPLAIDCRITRSTMNDGRMKVTLLPKKTLGESVSFRLSVRYGNLEYLTGKTTAAEMLPAMLVRGTKDLSRQDIKDELDNCRAQVSTSGGAGRVTVMVQAQRSRLPRVMEIVKQILREPSFPQEELELIRQAALAVAEQRLTDPRAIAGNVVMEQLSAYERDDPRYVTTLQEDVDRIQTLTIEEITSLYENSLHGSVGEVTVVGDFDPREVQPVIADLLDGWVSEVEYTRISYEFHNNRVGRFQEINTPDKAQANYEAAMALPIRDDNEDFAALSLGNYIFGGGLASRLGKRVRQQEGLSYGVGSSLRGSPLDERSVFSIRAICAPDKTDRIREVIDAELKRLLASGVTKKELLSQSAGYLHSRRLSRTADTSLIVALANQAFLGRTMQFVEDFETKIRELTMPQVNAALQKYIDPDRLYVVVAGDFNRNRETS